MGAEVPELPGEHRFGHWQQTLYEGAFNKWLEPVSVEDYNKLK